MPDHISFLLVNVRIVGVPPNTAVPLPDAFYVPNLVMVDQTILHNYARVPIVAPSIMCLIGAAVPRSLS